jgi:ribosomal protein S18 acetylase RimI-like enzyme
MNAQEADEIAELLNRRNQLTVVQTAEQVLEHATEYAFKTLADRVIGAVQVKRVQWYQAELCHLTIHEDYENQGHARQLALDAEKVALSVGARILQCTIRDGNGGSERLFRAAGYCRAATFYNQHSENYVCV